MEDLDLIALFIPAWLGLIVLELVLTRWRGKHWYRLSDTINSLSLGTIYTTSSAVTKVIGLATYLFAYEQAMFTLPENSLWVWLVAFVFYDLCYYWNHRLGHEINILWASHSVHHQSEDYNLSTGLRQSSTSFIFGWIFYIPMALLGFSPLVFLVVGGVSAIYQFWIHTRHVPKLGLLEKILVTPSSHRVHHGSNPVYMDKNYGGVFILWDRLFSSYQEELDREPVNYGISKPLRSWNPLWANLVGYVDLAKDAGRAGRWQDKWSIWFRQTGWRPADVAKQYPRPARSEHYQNYDAKPSVAVGIYITVQFCLNMAMAFAYLAIADTQSLSFNSMMAAMFLLQLTLIARVLENKPWGWFFENARLIAILPVTYLCLDLELLSDSGAVLVLSGVLLSMISAALVLRTPSVAQQSASGET